MLGTVDPPGFLPDDDARGSLAAVAPLLRDADLTFVNLEGPLCDSGESSKCKTKKTCYAFRSPTRYAQHLADAGVDLASTANNHAGDFGEACRRQTEGALDGVHIAWSGPVGTIGTVTAKGRTVALLGFHTSGATNDVRDLRAAAALVKQAKAKADLVVVSFHGGAEGTHATRVVDGVEMYLGENRGDLKAFAHAVVDAGADLVLGHGPHVVRGLELYQGHLIAYSMGNFATYGRFDLSGPLKVGVILEATLGERGELTGGRLLSTVQEGKGVPRPDPSAKAAAMIRELSALDFPKSAPRFGDGDTFGP